MPPERACAWLLPVGWLSSGVVSKHGDTRQSYADGRCKPVAYVETCEEHHAYSIAKIAKDVGVHNFGNDVYNYRKVCSVPAPHPLQPVRSIPLLLHLVFS